MTKSMKRNRQSKSISKTNGSTSKKKHNSNSFSFIYCTKPLHKVAKCFGLLCFSIRLSGENEMIGAYISIFDGIWFIIQVVFNITVIFCVIYTFQGIETGQFQTIFFFTLSRTILLFDLFLTLLVQLLDMINRSKLVQILKEFRAFDKEVQSIEMSFDGFFKVLI